jgi:type II secretory pathway predicted ATPase ExeA
VNDQSLPITQNLHAALLHLRHSNYSRIIWVDAICIDHENDKEKEHQVVLIAEIFAKADRVVVWLGEAADNSDEALEAIRLMAEKSASSSHAESAKLSIMQLLQRPWFERIWVRTEALYAIRIN